MRISLVCASIGAVALAACAPPSPPQVPVADERAAIGAALDDFHDAAAKADEGRYFGHFAPDGVFLGTDATERWDVAAFLAYAAPHFARKKAWTFRSTRRVVTVGEGGAVAWFDEDLATQNLGPARGSGVLVKRGAEWKISQYNLTITVPNARFEAVKKAAAGDAASP